MMSSVHIGESKSVNDKCYFAIGRVSADGLGTAMTKCRTPVKQSAKYAFDGSYIYSLFSNYVPVWGFSSGNFTMNPA